MKLAFLATVSYNLAVAYGYDFHGAIPQLFGADQLADAIGADETQPDYCYSRYENPDFRCYKDGFPKCCTKDKGNCPNNNKPGCECDGDCNPGSSGNGGSNGRSSGDRCEANRDCVIEEFCLFADGDCGSGQGRCELIPYFGDCSSRLDYVCGCDGRTYDNECAAFSYEESIDFTGECRDNTRNGRCEANQDCESDEFCLFERGDCGLGNNPEGRCEVIPDPRDCSTRVDKVCGCDERTYDNECEAFSFEESIDYTGECRDNSGNRRCQANRECNSDEFCKFVEGDCGFERNGRCEVIPDPRDCSTRVDKVCGCDDRTYDNECDAFSFEESIDYTGECGGNSNNRGDSCEENEDCDSDEFCLFERGDCGFGNNPRGFCTTIPRHSSCSTRFDEVCGCDGRTYDNECDALAFRESIDHSGECH